MTSIGRKKKTKKTKRITAQAIVSRNRKKRAAGTAPKVRELKTPKRFNVFRKNYEAAVESGQLDKVKAFEKEIAEISKYLNKDGSPSKTALRSRKSQEEFNRLIKQFNKDHRKWGKKFFQEKGVEQEIIKTKGASTFTQKELKNISTKTKGDKSLTEIALDISTQYRKMVDLFALDSFEKLREQINIGSPVVERLAGSKLSLEDADKYFTDFLEAKKTMPKEAQKLASQDDLNAAIVDLIKLAGKDNVKDALELYMLSNGRQREMVVNVAIYHAEHNSKRSLSDFYFDIVNSKNPLRKTDWRAYL